MRECTKCRQVKPLDAFRRVGYERWRTDCKACCNAANRARYRDENGHARMIAKHRLRRYGLTSDAYDALMAKQAGRCAVCQVELASLQPRDVHVDHDHTSGAVRGLLCHPCNVRVVPVAEGTFVTAELLARAAEYLRRAQTSMTVDAP